MEHTVIPTDDRALEAAMDEMFAEMRELNARTRRDRVEIEQLKRQSHALEAKGDALRRETRAILASLAKPA